MDEDIPVGLVEVRQAEEEFLTRRSGEERIWGRLVEKGKKQTDIPSPHLRPQLLPLTPLRSWPVHSLPKWQRRLRRQVLRAEVSRQTAVLTAPGASIYGHQNSPGIKKAPTEKKLIPFYKCFICERKKWCAH